jgi:antirestriction protein ArdC
MAQSSTLFGDAQAAPSEASSPADRRKSLQERIDKLCARILAGDDTCFAEYLKQQALFHGYSWRNTMLIWSQYPEASQVGGLKSHWNKVGRRVRKGEKAIWILAPCTVAQRVEGDEEGEKGSGPTVTFFRPVPVFDVSQTDGKPLADWRDKYAGQVDLMPALLGLAREKGFTVEAGPTMGAGGYITPKGEIHLSEAHEVSRQVLTLAHELAHGCLEHHLRARVAKDGAAVLTREVVEAEAEAVACVVMAHWGHEGYEVSAGYIRSWGRTAEAGVKLVKESLARISDTARAMIADLERLLDEPRPVVVAATAAAVQGQLAEVA